MMAPGEHLPLALCVRNPWLRQQITAFFGQHTAFGVRVACEADSSLELLAALPPGFRGAAAVDLALGAEGLSLCTELLGRGVQPVLLLGEELSPGVIQRAQGLGLPVVPGYQPRQVGAALGRAATPGSAAPAAGPRVGAFWGARGGAGTTTLALGTALHLAARGARVALVEFGSCSDLIRLAPDPSPGWAALATHLGAADEAQDLPLLDHALCPIGAGGQPVYLLPASGPVVMDSVRSGAVEALLPLLLAYGFDFVLLDLPGEVSERVAAAVVNADLVALVATPDPGCAWRLAQLEAFAGQLQVPPGQVRLILNRTRELPAGFRPPALVVPDDPKGAAGEPGRPGFRPGSPGDQAAGLLSQWFLGAPQPNANAIQRLRSWIQR